MLHSPSALYYRYTSPYFPLLKEPLIALFSALRVPLSPLGLLSVVLGVCLGVIGFAKEPVKAFFLGAIGSYYRGFSSFIYRVALHDRTSVSGGCHNMKELI